MLTLLASLSGSCVLDFAERPRRALAFDVDSPLQPVWNWLCRILAEIK